ncbi:MAG: alpha/beta hydrolase [Acidobacteriota bacterium]|nr:alpha/beta hydrolase [Acidobacteriota bacterium]
MKHKKRLTAVMLLAFTSVLSGTAQQSQQSGKLEDPPWIKQVAPARVLYTVPNMEQVKVKKDVVYKRAADVELKADVYSRADSKSGARLPAIIFIHGGLLPPNLLTKPKEWGVYISYGQIAAASGFVGVTFNHRFYSWNNLGEPQSDVNDLVAYVRNNAESLGVDKDRIILWAFSGGTLLLSQSLRDAPPHIRCMISYYGVLDLQDLRKRIPATISDETLNPFSPLHNLSDSKNKLPPMFVARAGLDADLSGGVDRFVQAALTKKATIDFSNHPVGQHGFDILDDNQRTREIIKQTLEFIREHS